MKSQTLTLFLLCLLVNLASAQSETNIYRTKEGKIYTLSQKDSIASLGYPIAVINKTTVKDTNYHDIEIFPKRDKDGSEFVKRYKDQKLPPFQLKTLDGRTITNKDLAGKIVMINFWSTTCGPCIQEMPELNQLKRSFDKQVVFLAPAPEDAKVVKQFLQKHSFDFTILPNADKLFKEWGIEGYPRNFFVSKDGMIKEIKEGTPQYRESTTDKWKLAVYKDYSAVLKELTNK